jgi:hypothetical protein
VQKSFEVSAAITNEVSSKQIQVSKAIRRNKEKNVLGSNMKKAFRRDKEKVIRNK